MIALGAGLLKVRPNCPRAANGTTALFVYFLSKSNTIFSPMLFSPHSIPPAYTTSRAASLTTEFLHQ